jgi:predicted GNAT family acetyltransferase
MHDLDNVIWKALTTSQAKFAESYKLARKFPAEVTSLGAFLEPTEEGYDSLADLVKDGSATGLFLAVPPQLPKGWTLVATVPLLQMVHENGRPFSATSPATSGLIELIELTGADVPEMVALAELTKPGPIGRRTRELGTYRGIRLGGSLVAMAGERLKLPGYTEVSAVCTHPNHTGNGYAAALIRSLVEEIRRRREVAFLHVRHDNLRAIGLYEHLGFRKRVQLHLAVVRKIA